MTHSGARGGFQFLLILDLWGKSFHAVVVFGLDKNLLFNPCLAWDRKARKMSNQAATFLRLNELDRVSK